MFKTILIAFLITLSPLTVTANDDEFESDDYLSFSRNAQTEAHDPIEGVNRAVFGFNQFVDRILLNPVAEGYNYLPSFARNRVYNVMENLEAPVVFANSILQGDPQNTFVTFWRFVFNSTFGVLGMFDMATEFGMPPRHDEDFGQTLGVWGVGNGPYLMLPIIGPSNLRDAPSRVVDIFMSPWTYALDSNETIIIGVVDAVDTRARLDGVIDQVNETSLDPYATFRSLYLQRRDAEINNFQR